MSFGIPQRHRVQFMPEPHIEREADALLAEFAAAGHEFTVPIPIDDIIELHLELQLEIDDLRGRFGSDDVLGAIWLEDGRIAVDRSLDHHRHTGRFNFTLAHEVGHWRLHRHQILASPDGPTLFEVEGRLGIICRDGAKAPEEWQANTFAGYLLMPREHVRAAWQEWRGDDEPVPDAELDVDQDAAKRDSAVRIARERFVRPFADQFNVSAMAMRIRLEKLNLLVREVEPRLF